MALKNYEEFILKQIYPIDRNVLTKLTSKKIN